MNHLLSLDPGVSKGVGTGSFIDGRLHAAKLLPLEAALTFLRIGSFRVRGDEPARVVIEIPVVYRLEQQKGGAAGQNDLIQLARVVGRLEQAALSAGHTVEIIEPRTWAGSVEHDEITVPRIWAALTAEERARIEWPVRFDPKRLPKKGSLNDDVMSGIGIGLWALGRLEPRKVYPR